MRRIVYILGVLLLSSLLLACKRQGLHFSSDHGDLGDILQDHQKKGTFILRNDTSRIIEIEHLNTSCGCTSADVNSNIILPGSTVEVTAVIAPGTRLGHYSSILSLEWKYADSPQVSEIKFRIIYSALRLIKTDPVVCDFGEVSADKPEMLEVEVDRGESKVPWNNIDVSSLLVDVGCKKVTQDKFALTILIPVDKIPVGLLKDGVAVNLLNDGAVVEQLIIPFQVRLVSNIYAIPPSLYCGVIDQHSPQVGKFLLESSGSAE